MLVTASVDDISLLHRANLRDDMTLGTPNDFSLHLTFSTAGEVAWVGRSSLEIHMSVTSSVLFRSFGVADAVTSGLPVRG